MIYTKDSEYRVKFYLNSRTGQSHPLDYINKLPTKEKAKVLKYIEFLREHKGILDEPYSRHIKDKIRELRVDFARNRFRIFYFLFVGKTIIILHAFSKRTSKTPVSEINLAERNYYDVLKNQKLYE